MSIDLMRQVYERDVDPTCQRVLLVLCDHANDDGLCWPSIPLIAWKLGASERTVMRSIQRLETSRVITVVRAVGMANHYRIDLSQLPEKSPRPLTKRHPGQNVTRDTGGAEPLTKCPPTRDIAMSPKPSVNHQENHQENVNPPLIPPASEPEPPAKPKAETVPSGWAAFWAAYPRHEEKQAALKQWRLLKPDADLQAAILRAIAAQKQGRKWREGYVKYPHRWLRDRNWEDEPESAPVALVDDIPNQGGRMRVAL